MRKTIALFVLAVFLISLMPMAFAENNSKENFGKKIVTAVKIAKNSNLTLDELKEKLGSKVEAVREHQKGQLMIAVDKCNEKNLTGCQDKYEKRIALVEKLGEKDLERLDKILENKAKHEADFEKLKNSGEFRQYKAEHAYKARVIVKEKLENARDKFTDAKERYSEAKEKYQDARLKFNETKEKLAECKNTNTTECAELGASIMTQAKEQLLNTADVMIEYLNKLSSKIESSEDLADSDANESIGEINAQISEIEAIKAKIEAAQTKEEITAVAKELKDKWAAVKNKAEIHAGKVVNARIGGIIVKSKQLETKLSSILERMTEKGKDTSAIAPLIVDFNAKLNEARIHYNLSLETFKEANVTNTPNSDLIKEAQGYMNDAHKALQDAQKILKDIVSAIKQNGGEDELEENDETTCTDSDSGINYNIKGTTTKGTESKQDYCQMWSPFSGDEEQLYLVEYACSNNDISFDFYECSNCSDGVCITQATN
ncbi:MAG: hypothetical protein Q7J54_04655 [Candidatus Woesearchaeota archaeon]|nr:hypothetical protein [Candidatus Woesearchaeota archaeon]